jgi:hypothetical protein
MARDIKLTRNKDMIKLRRRMDVNDNFMNAFQITKTRTMEREIPAWTLNDKEVQKVLLRAFPRLRTDNKAAICAGRWMRLIHLYYRVQMPNFQVAKEMNMSLNVVKTTLSHIRRVAKGRRADNTAPLIHTGRGRPRKNK